MSRKFREHYTAFQREILAEFMTETELSDLDKKYSQAKIKRLEQKLKVRLGLLETEFELEK